MGVREQTLNVTVAQIEDALLKGQTVPDFAREWSEPAPNVLAVYRRMQDEGRLPKNGPSQVATPPQRTLASVPPRTEPVSASVPSRALVDAAARSTSARTRAMGVRLGALMEKLLARLADERDAAELAERKKAEREAARAEVERLEAALREAKAKAGVSRHRNLSEAGRANLAGNAAKAHEVQRVDSPCRKGCGFVAKSTPGRASHERHCTGAA